jgi:hypothetical protein
LSYRSDLEQLFFFNPAQAVYRPAIRRTIEKLGMPEIAMVNGVLTLTLGPNISTETVFMLEQRGNSLRLRGVMIYSREPLDTLALIHLAVAADPSGDAPATDMNWGTLLVAKALEIAHQVRGISFVCLPYSRGRIRVKAA